MADDEKQLYKDPHRFYERAITQLTNNILVMNV